MTTLHKGITVPPLKQALPIFIALVAAGLVGNYLKYELFFNIQFIFGSIFAMLALQVLGLRFGTLAALLISSITYPLQNYPYAIVIMTGEVITVGLLIQRKDFRIVAADALYWITIGMPLVYLVHYGVMHLPPSNTTITMVKEAVNGIANTLAARLIFMALSGRLQKTQFSLQEVVFNLLAVSTLATALFLLVSQGRSELADSDRAIRAVYLAKVLAMLMITLVLAKMTSHWVVTSLNALKSISSTIPAKVSANEEIDWPETNIMETASLIDNFRAMALVLARQLNEIRGMNFVLEERVNERTRALRESEGRFRNFFDNAKVVALTIDPTNGAIIDANAAAVSYYGWPLERLLAMNISEINTLSPAKLSIEMELARSEKRSTFLFKHRRADGSIRDVEVYAGPIHANGKTVLYSLGHDVTERRQAEEALRQSEERLRFLSENLAEGMVYQINSGQDGTQRQFTYLSPAVERLHGLKVEDVQANPQLLYGQVIVEHQALLAEREALSFATKNTFDVDVMVCLPSGEVRWRRFVSVPRLQADGSIAWNGIELDITERKRLEESLRKSEALLKQTQEVSRVGGWEYDVARQRVTWTDEVYRIYEVDPSYDPNDIQQAVTFYAGHDQEVIARSFKRAVEEGEAYDLELQFVSAKGARKWVRTTGQAERVTGKTVRVFGHIMDTTERKQAEEQIRQSLREKETLLKEVHHRVKNNLAVVSSLLSLQAKQIKDESLKEMFEESQQRIKSIALVHEKLYRSKDLSCIDFGGYITAIIGELRSSYLREGGVIGVNISADNICLDIDTAIPCGLIINELVTNAFKYAFPGNRSGEVGISVAKFGTRHTLMVKDNGIGLPAGFDHTRTGTLGLQLVEALTRQLRGSLAIRSEAGTEAVVTFPRKGDELEIKVSASGQGLEEARTHKVKKNEK